METFPGRITIPVRVPDELVAEAERIAELVGKDRAIVLGDLVASVLPDALAEAARDLLAFNAAGPGPSPGSACDHAPTISPTASVVAPANEPGAARGARA